MLFRAVSVGVQLSVGLILLTTAPAKAGQAGSVAVPDGIDTTVPADFDCNSQWLNVSHNRSSISGFDPLGIEAAVVATAENAIARCPNIGYLRVVFVGANGVREGGGQIQEEDMWQSMQRKRESLRALQASGNAARAEQVPWVPGTPHDLEQRGYFASWLKYAGDSFKLYVAQPTRGDQKYLVAEHSIADDERLFETVTKADRIYPAASFTAALQAAFDTFNLAGVEYRSLRHYVKGYQHPKDDRRLVMGPRGTETPLLDQQLKVYWLDRAMVHPRQPSVGFVSVPQATQLLSVAAARRMLGERAEVAVDRETLPPEGPSAEYREGQRRLRAAAIQHGYVYKNEDYWLSFQGDHLRPFFNGNSKGGHQTLITTYLDLVQNQCPELLGDDPGMFVITRTVRTFNGHGHEIDATTSHTQKFVKRRFVPVFAAYYDIEDSRITIPKAVSAAIGTLQMSGADVRLAMDDKRRREEAAEDMRALFARESCDSPVLAQMEENLYRSVTDAPSVQDQPMRFPGAAAATDELYPPGPARTIARACLASSDFGHWRESLRRYCECVGPAVRRIVSPEQAEVIRTGYRQFQRDMHDVGKLIEYGEKPAKADLYYAYRGCTSVNSP